MSDDETRPEHAAMDDGEDPTEHVGDFTDSDVDLSHLLGDDQQDQDDDLEPEVSDTEEFTALAEEGQRLASERDDLIAQGADPTELAVPMFPSAGQTTDDEEAEQNG